MNNFQLIKLSQEYKPQYLKFANENAEDLKKTGFRFRFPVSTEDTFDDDLRVLENKICGINIPDWEVPNSTFFLYEKSRDKIVGGVNIRHKLEKRYLIDGGHIGYYISINERSNGYGKLILKLELEICKHMGIEKVLVTCTKENKMSSRVILANGGVFEKEIECEFDGKRETFNRYWIDLINF